MCKYKKNVFNSFLVDLPSVSWLNLALSSSSSLLSFCHRLYSVHCIVITLAIHAICVGSQHQLHLIA